MSRRSNLGQQILNDVARELAAAALIAIIAAIVSPEARKEYRRLAVEALAATSSWRSQLREAPAKLRAEWQSIVEEAKQR